jgi:RNA polymerase sigma-70 factor, ECF subfamily
VPHGLGNGRSRASGGAKRRCKCTSDSIRLPLIRVSKSLKIAAANRVTRVDASKAIGAPSTHSSLLNLIRDSDPRAWGRFVAVYGPLVYRWLRRWGVTADDARDVSQEVFRRVATAVGRFERRGDGGFRAWLWTIARREAIDHLGRLNRSPHGRGGSTQHMQLLQIPEQLPSDDDSTENDNILLLRAALETIRGDFQEQTWEIFWRAAMDGEDAADLAKEFGVSQGAVRQAKYRVLHRLREEFGDLLN